MNKTLKNLCTLIDKHIRNGVNIICMKFYICMVAEGHATPETQLLCTHKSSFQYSIVIFILLANLHPSNLWYF